MASNGAQIHKPKKIKKPGDMRPRPRTRNANKRTAGLLRAGGSWQGLFFFFSLIFAPQSQRYLALAFFPLI
jgi:hypothetical protein